MSPAIRSGIIHLFTKPRQSSLPTTDRPVMQQTTLLPLALSERARRTGPQPISYLMAQAVENKEIISLAAGLVDQDSLPVASVARQLSDLFAAPQATSVLQYSTTAGDAELRKTLLEHLAGLDRLTPEAMNATPDDVVITNGSQQLLYLLTEVLVDPGDIVITDYPSYFVYTGLLESAGADVRCVPMDQNGLIPQALEQLLTRLEQQNQLRRVKMLYLCDYHQNPSGISLAESRRPEIVRIIKAFSRDHRIIILEDAAYREITFQGDPPHSIRRYDEDGQTVALAATFSKPLSPGIKLGYGLLPTDLVAPVVLTKGNHDFGTANICQQLALGMLKSGAYAEHVQTIRKLYHGKCRTMLDALQANLGDFHPGTTHWTRPTGGLYVYLTLPPEMDTGRDGPLFQRAIEEGVLYVPGEFCYPANPDLAPPKSAMRLSFGLVPAKQIPEGIARLARAIRKTFDPT